MEASVSPTTWLYPGAPTAPSLAAMFAAETIGDIMVALWRRTALLTGSNTDVTDDAEIISLYDRLQDELERVQDSGIKPEEIFTAHAARFGGVWNGLWIIGSLRSVINGMQLPIRRVGTLATPLGDAEEIAFHQALTAFRQGDANMVATFLSQLADLRAGRGLTEEVDWNMRVREFRDFVPVGIVF